MFLPRRAVLALILGSVVLPRAALAADLPFSAADIEAATYDGGDLPPGRSPLTAKVQMLLDRAGISPGVTDGYKGGMSESAIRAFERQRGLPVTGVMNEHIWAQLQAHAVEPVTQTYTITAADAADLVAEIPIDYAEKAKMSHLGYTSIGEKLGERFHMDQHFIGFLNPGIALDPGSTIAVMRPAKRLRAEVTRIIIDKATRRVSAYGIDGLLIADYPATVGSDTTPSPSGTHIVEAVALNPNYTYNPSKNFKQGDNDKPLVVPPGPNGPVGTVWIDLSQPTYGIHGTPTPSQLFVNQSYGCVRLTNWDADELAHMVKVNVTTVEFLEPGQTIADVTEPVAPPILAASGSGAVASAQEAALESTGPDAATAAMPPAGRPLPRPESVILVAAAANAAPLPTGPDGASVAQDPLAAALSAASDGVAAVQAPTAATASPVNTAPAMPQGGQPAVQPVPDAGAAPAGGGVVITPAAPKRP